VEAYQTQEKENWDQAQLAVDELKEVVKEKGSYADGVTIGQNQ